MNVTRELICIAMADGISIDLDEAVDIFAKKHPRKLQLLWNILSKKIFWTFIYSII